MYKGGANYNVKKIAHGLIVDRLLLHCMSFITVRLNVLSSVDLLSILIFKHTYLSVLSLV